jgi:hypothetical protein
MLKYMHLKCNHALAPNVWYFKLKITQNNIAMKTMAVPTSFDVNAPEVRKFIADAQNPWKMGLYMFQNVPGAFFFGLKIKELTHSRSVVWIPFNWRTKNPFRSVYFVAQMAAAEMSTASLAKVALAGRGKVSMLVTEADCRFLKKATTPSTFTCEDGQLVLDAVQRALETGEGQTAKLRSVGRNDKGEVVSEFSFTWSFKKKS